MPVDALEDEEDPELEPDALPEELDPLEALDPEELDALPEDADPDDEAALPLCVAWLLVELPLDVLCEVPAPSASDSLDESKVKGFAVPPTQMQTM